MTMSPGRATLFPCKVRLDDAVQEARHGERFAAWLQIFKQAAGGEQRGRLARLQALLSGAEEGTLHYPERFAAAGVQHGDLRALADLRHFPTLTRLELQGRFLELFHRDADAQAMEEGYLGSTSGSTGAPIRFFMDAGSIHLFVAFLQLLWDHHRLGPPPRAGSTGVVLLCTLPRSSIYEAPLPFFHGTRFRKLHLDEEDADRTLTRLAASVLTGDPASLERLAQAIEEGRVRVAPRLILSSAFALPDALAARLSALTGARVIDYYSTAETGPLAWRCPSSGRRHVLEGAVELEEKGGELLVTNLRNRFFPLIRYHTGDLATLEVDRCPCGFAGRSLGAFQGRVASRFLTRSGARIDPSQLQPLLSALPLKQFQLVQAAAGEVILRYFGDAVLPPGRLAELAEGMATLLGPTRLVLEPAGAPLFLPGEKPLPYLSRLTR